MTMLLQDISLMELSLKRNERDEIVENALIDVTLWDEVKDSLLKKGTFLSGGQQQRSMYCKGNCFQS